MENNMTIIIVDIHYIKTLSSNISEKLYIICEIFCDKAKC